MNEGFEGFDFFKNGVGGQIMERAGFDLENVNTWDDLTRLIQDNRPQSLTSLKKAHGWMSSGERPVIEAVLCACDFARQADQLARGRAYDNITSMSGDHLKTWFAILSGRDL